MIYSMFFIHTVQPWQGENKCTQCAALERKHMVVYLLPLQTWNMVTDWVRGGVEGAAAAGHLDK